MFDPRPKSRPRKPPRALQANHRGETALGAAYTRALDRQPAPTVEEREFIEEWNLRAPGEKRRRR